MEFTRKTRLAEYFHEVEIDDPSILRNKSSFIPPKNRNEALDTFAKSVENIPLNTLGAPHTRHNIDKDQRAAIKSISRDDSIIIKEADKGGTVVILDKIHYKNMCESILMDNIYYKKLKSDPQKSNNLKYRKHLKKFKKCLTDHETKYLENFEEKTSQFYGLPKIHKSNTIRLACLNTESSVVNITDVTDLKLRPIVAGPSCLTNRLSNLLDKLLKPLVEEIPSYLKDTTDFLRKLPSTTSENTLLVSFDVESLYSNISHDLGLEALEFWINKFQDRIPERFSKDFILDSMKFILENNTFQFNDDFFKQIRGTAMGTRVAPIYATLTIGYLEEKLYSIVSEDLGEEFSIYFKEMWKRFLDDCFILWNKPKEDLLRLHNTLNNLHQYINFTMEVDENNISFLDCKVIKIGSNIETDIFYKPTDSKSYLLFSSCHTKHTKTNIPFSLARRLKLIISNPNTLQIRFEELIEFLRNQGYPLSLITRGIEKANALDRGELLNQTQNNKSNQKNIIPLINTHNPLNPKVFEIIRADIDILRRDTDMKAVLENTSFINSKRQPPNLKTLLTRAKFSENTRTGKVSKCNRGNCGLCKHLIEASEYTFKCGITKKLKYDMTCTVKNVIYVLICDGCGYEYIGESGNLRARMRVHRQQSTYPELMKLNVNKHIFRCATSKTKFKVFPFFKMEEESIALRRKKEKDFIKHLKPALN